MAAETTVTTPPAGAEAPMPPSNEPFRPQETLDQTINRLANLVNGTDTQRPDANPLKFLEEARKRSDAFRDYYETPDHKINEAKRRELSDWIARDEGESGGHELEKVANAFGTLWRSFQRPGLPGHDKRHLQEDIKTGLQFRQDVVTNNTTDNYQKASLLGSWMHDVGRLAEERVQGTPTGGEMGAEHPKMSFVIVKDVLDHFQQIPQELRDHIAYAVLSHQDWLTDKTKRSYEFTMNEPMPRSVMGADRLQLVGPEGILRMFGFDVGVSKKLEISTSLNPERKVKLDSKANTDLFHHMEFYMRNLLPVDVPGSPERANSLAKARADRYKAITGTFLWLSSTDETREQIFAPELGKAGVSNEDLIANKKRPLDAAVWEQIKQVKDGGLPSEIQAKITAKLGGRTIAQLETLSADESTQLLRVLSREMVSAANASVTDEELNQINTKLNAIPAGQARARLAEGLSYAIAMREQLDGEHTQMVNTILQDRAHYSPHSLEVILSQFVKSQEPQARAA